MIVYFVKNGIVEKVTSFVKVLRVADLVAADGWKDEMGGRAKIVARRALFCIERCNCSICLYVILVLDILDYR